VLGPLSRSTSLSPESLTDRAVRVLLPRALDGRGAAEAAAQVRALPEVTGADAARSTMPALERIARATQAPSDLVRAGSQCAGALLRAGLPGGEEAGPAQLVSAVTRLALAAARSGLTAADLVALLAA
jgi:hypothetical protein